jgi:hypothetical protein
MTQSRSTVPHLLLSVLLLLHLSSHVLRDVKVGCLIDGTSCGGFFLLLKSFIVKVDVVVIIIVWAKELQDEILNPWSRTHDMEDDVSERRVGVCPCTFYQSVNVRKGKGIINHALDWKIPKGLDAYMSAISWSISIIQDNTRKVR